MFYLGIDISKTNHVASLLNSESNIVFKAFSFTNTLEGGKLLLEKLESALPIDESLEIGMEATGHYWLSLYAFLVEEGYAVHVINPIQTDSWRKGSEIRKRKTDAIDSVLIAELLRYGNFVETSLTDEDTLSLRNLTRFRSYLVSSISDLKRKTICVLDQIFPEYQSVFSNVFGKTSSEILLQFQSPKDFQDISAGQIETLLEKVSLKKFASSKITKISQLASDSFGLRYCSDTFSLQLKFLLEQIRFIEAQVSDVEKEIAFILEKLNSPITTIPGIGNVIGATILGEIGDIQRFSNPAKLVAYTGLDASIA